ncbi:MAG: peptidoglycan editing factor PgeF [Anaeromyxobacter sp.]|nr:peptidoglycan editing factor PgeF [Anaeromyxobacter sp.]MBL0278651.1 peptidoglycan editing factor PgeF [Anaeromyxobacter sp.]
MEILESRLLAGLPHGFTTRAGGASPPPWDALNLGDLVGDDPAAVAENWRRLEAATGLAFARVRQVHGVAVARAEAPSAPCQEADAVVSVRPGLAACVAVADCVPLLLAAPHGAAVAAVHAGWRGSLERAAAAGVRALAGAAGVPAGRLRAVVGPSIGPCCYEVSPELAARFEAAFGPAVVVRAGGAAPRLDLWAANLSALREAGVVEVEVLGRCTACERQAFFSHRRDAGRTGRMVAFAAPPPISARGAVP